MNSCKPIFEVNGKRHDNTTLKLNNTAIQIGLLETESVQIV